MTTKQLIQIAEELAKVKPSASGLFEIATTPGAQWLLDVRAIESALGVSLLTTIDKIAQVQTAVVKSLDEFAYSHEKGSTLYDALHSHDGKKKKWKRELGPGKPGRPRTRPLPSDLEDSGDSLSHGQLSGDR